MSHPLRWSLPLVAALFVGGPGRTEEPARYPATKHGRGELRYVNGVPVLSVAGTPEEIGEQTGTLVLKPAVGLTKLLPEFLKVHGLERAYPLLIRSGRGLLPGVPEAHRRELDAAARAGGWERDFLIFTNTVYDLTALWGCSTLVVEPRRSATGGPLFGRNLDFQPVGQSIEFSLVTVCRPAGKNAFVAVGLPTLVGVASGVNEHGLAVAWLDVAKSPDGSPALDPQGTPLMFCFRRVLEECATVEEAGKLLRTMKRTRAANLAVCDRQGGAVFELTPKTVAERRAEDGLCACTNHFRTPDLAGGPDCWRYTELTRSRALKSLDVADVVRHLHAANQGPATQQTMVFEPAALRLHVAYGPGPSTARPLKALDLGPLLRREGPRPE